MEMTVVTDPDLEYNKYGVKRASDIQKKGSKIIENRNQQYYFKPCNFLCKSNDILPEGTRLCKFKLR